MAGMAPPKAAPTDDSRLLDDDDETPNVTPEEQDAYDEFIAACTILVLEGEGKDSRVRPGILKLLDEDPADLVAVLGDAEMMKEFSPIVAVAATAVMVVLEVERLGAEEAPDDGIIGAASREVYEMIVDIAEKSTGADFAPDEVNRGFLMAQDIYREAAKTQGLVDEEELKAQFEQIVAADKEGRLGEVLPQLDRINQLAEEDAAGAVEGEEDGPTA